MCLFARADFAWSLEGQDQSMTPPYLARFLVNRFKGTQMRLSIKKIQNSNVDVGNFTIKSGRFECEFGKLIIQVMQDVPDSRRPKREPINVHSVRVPRLSMTHVH